MTVMCDTPLGPWSRPISPRCKVLLGGFEADHCVAIPPSAGVGACHPDPTVATQPKGQRVRVLSEEGGRLRGRLGESHQLSGGITRYLATSFPEPSP